MKLKKEFILASCIIIFIFSLEIITNYISNKSVEKISKGMNEILEYLMQNNNLNIQGKLSDEKKYMLNEKIGILKNEWIKEQNKLSMFAEHDELEKVTKCIIVLEENVKNEEYTSALEDGREFLYWLEHFKDKDKIEIKTIF